MFSPKVVAIVCQPCYPVLFSAQLPGNEVKVGGVVSLLWRGEGKEPGYVASTTLGVLVGPSYLCVCTIVLMSCDRGDVRCCLKIYLASGVN